MSTAFTIRELEESEFAALGQLMVEVYSNLPGFPSPQQQPRYYELLANIGRFTERRGVSILVADSAAAGLLGGVVYFAEMTEYGSGGTATAEVDAAGIRLLGVGMAHRGLGVGKALTLACIARARAAGRSQVILHTTEAMQVAWGLYEKLGFARSQDLDFLQEDLPVFGFRLRLGNS